MGSLNHNHNFQFEFSMQAIDDKFIGLDTHGVPITVNYRGSDMYKTRMGSVFSLIAYFLILFFALKNGNKLVNRLSPSITVTEETRDLSNDDEAFGMKTNGIAFFVESTIIDETDENVVIHDIPEKYARWQAFQVSIPSKG